MVACVMEQEDEKKKLTSEVLKKMIVSVRSPSKEWLKQTKGKKNGTKTIKAWKDMEKYK